MIKPLCSILSIEQPMILRELGGYKFFQKPSDTIDTSTKRKANRADENKPGVNEMTALKKTVAEQKENITNREKHVLHLEKKLAMSEHENSKNKKQISSFREKLKDCSGTVDYLRREKETLASERDRLSFTLLTCEHELKELRTQNLNLVTEYESAEHSRKIAVGHLHEVERTCQESHQEKPDPTKPVVVKKPLHHSDKESEKNSERISGKLFAQLTSMKEAVQNLRNDREAFQDQLRKVSSFFAENIQTVVEQVRDIEAKRIVVPEICPREVISSEQVSLSEDVFAEPEESSEGVSELESFKKKLKSNEQRIDELANQIRDFENRKKELLETRFAMIQEFQAGREVVGDWEADMSGNDMEEKSEHEVGGGDRKRSRVTKKIRKLERTLSMDHEVGKLDCIQKLCKKLEDCEQRIHELETTNSELRAEHDDMEEEAKYLKYVLSYRGDVMKAQLENEYETKMAALKAELAEGKNSEKARSEVQGLRKRNRALEEEVQRLHEELSTLLQNFPALQAVQRSSSRSSEYESENSAIFGNVSADFADVSTNFADVSTNFADVSTSYLDSSQNGNDVSRIVGDGQTTTGTAESENNIENSANDLLISQNGEVDNSEKHDGREVVESLEEKVVQLTEEKRVLLLSMQTLTGQWASRGHASESDASFSARNASVLERNLREVKQEKACFAETLQHIRATLEQTCESENGDEQKDKILKLKHEIERLDEKIEAGRRNITLDDEDSLKADTVCGRHENRISELEMEIYRLHEEKKSLLSSIVRLQTDPNFTLSDDISYSDVTSDDVISSDVSNGDVTDAVKGSPMKNIAVGSGLSGCTAKDNGGDARLHSPLAKRSSRDEEVQVNMNREGIYGLLGYLQRDLDKLRTALDQEGISGNQAEKEDSTGHGEW